MVDRLVNSESNARRIDRVESCFGTAGDTLQSPGRVLVGEGVLTKICRKKPKPRQFFLFNDLLVYGSIVINNKKFNRQRIIPLEEVKLQPLEDNGHIKNGWLICARGKSFAVSIGTNEEKQEWMAHINWCVEDVLRKSGKKPAERHAAVWVPDRDVDCCMQCSATQFSLVNRRHHCRQCGKVVCANCSDRRFLLPAVSPKPSRVCVSCHRQLESSCHRQLQSSCHRQLESSCHRQLQSSCHRQLESEGKSEATREMGKEDSSIDSSGDEDTTDEDSNGDVEPVSPSFYGTEV